MAYREVGYRPTRHSSDQIKGSTCNGRPCLEVVFRRHRWHTYEEYWCSRRHCWIDPMTICCDYQKED